MTPEEQDSINSIINTLKESTETNEDLINGHYTEKDLIEFFMQTIDLQKDITRELEMLVDDTKIKVDYTEGLLDLIDLVREYKESLFHNAYFNGILTDIINAYTFNKFHSSFELFDLDIKLKEELDAFLESLNEFFLVKTLINDQTDTSFSPEIYISRFKNVYKWDSENKFKDSVNCDIYGPFYGYNARQVFNYIKKMGYYHLIK